MSFGFSVGDFVTVGTLTWNLYKACSTAPESIGSLCGELASLHAVLKQIEEAITRRVVSPSEQERLATVVKGCSDVLRDLQTLVEKYNGPGGGSQRSWKNRLKWGFENIDPIRNRLISNTVLLTAFWTTSECFVETRLHQVQLETQCHERSSMTAETIDSLSVNDKRTWRTIRKELEDFGITIAAFDHNKDFIIGWLKEAKEIGSLANIPPGRPHTEVISRAEQDAESPSDSSSIHQTETDSSTSTLHVDSARKIDLDLPNESPLDAFLTATRLRTPEILSSTNLKQASGSSFSIRSEENPSAGDLISAIENVLERQPNLNRSLRLSDLDHWAIGSSPSDSTEASRYQEEYVTDVIKRRINQGLDTDTENTTGQTILDFAASRGLQVIVQEMLKAGANVEAVSINGNTALHSAASAGDDDIAQILLRHGASATARAANGDTPLHLAAKEGHSSVIRSLLQKNSGSVEAVNQLGQTALHCALNSEKGCHTFQYFTRRGDLAAVDNYGHTALHYAAYQDAFFWDILKSMCNTLDPNAKDIYSCSPWHYAALNHLNGGSALNALIKTGLSIDGKGIDTNPVLVISHTSKEPSPILTEVFASKPFLRRKRGWLALHMMALIGHSSMVEVLLKAGADIEARDIGGFTALHCAVARGHLALADLLLRRGANVNARILPHDIESKFQLLENTLEPNFNLLHHLSNRDSISKDLELAPIHIAAHEGYCDVLELLVAHGADLNVKTTEGRSPLDLAAIHNHLRVVDTLNEAELKYRVGRLI